MTDEDLARALDLGDLIENEANQAGALAHFTAYAREEAIEAASAILDLNPYDVGFIARFCSLQNEVRRYRELVAWTLKSQHAAKDAWDQLDPEEQRAIAQILTNPTPEFIDA
jgi:hypothetical protein